MLGPRGRRLRPAGKERIRVICQNADRSSRWRTLAASQTRHYHACGITTGRSLLCWGNGSPRRRNHNRRGHHPVQIGKNGDWAEIALGTARPAVSKSVGSSFAGAMTRKSKHLALDPLSNWRLHGLGLEFLLVQMTIADCGKTKHSVVLGAELLRGSWQWIDSEANLADQTAR